MSDLNQIVRSGGAPALLAFIQTHEPDRNSAWYFGFWFSLHPNTAFPLLVEALTDPGSAWAKLPSFCTDGSQLAGAFNAYASTNPTPATIAVLMQHQPLVKALITSVGDIKWRTAALPYCVTPAATLCGVIDIRSLEALFLEPEFRDYVRKNAGPLAGQIPQAFHRDRQPHHFVLTLLHVPELVQYLSVSQRTRLPGWAELELLVGYRRGDPVPVDAQTLSRWKSWIVYGESMRVTIESFFGLDASVEVEAGFSWTSPSTTKLSRTTMQFGEHFMTLKGQAAPFAWRLACPTAMLHVFPGLSTEKEAHAYLHGAGTNMIAISSLRRNRYNGNVPWVPDSKIPEGEQLRHMLLTILSMQEATEFCWDAWAGLYPLLPPDLQAGVRPYLQQLVASEGMRFALAADLNGTPDAGKLVGWQRMVGLVIDGAFVLPPQVTALIS